MSEISEVNFEMEAIERPVTARFKYCRFDRHFDSMSSRCSLKEHHICMVHIDLHYDADQSIKFI